MKKTAFYSDVFFAFFATFLFSVCFFRYLRVGLFLSLFLAVVCGILLSAAITAFLLSKRKNLHLKKADETQREKLMCHLALLSEEKQTEFFKNALADNEEIKKFAKLRLFSSSCFYFLHFRFSPVTADEVAAYARLKTGKEKILLCSSLEDSAKSLCDRLGFTVKTSENVYLFLKERDKLPENYLCDEDNADKRKRRFKLWFSKRNGNPFSLGAQRWRSPPF